VAEEESSSDRPHPGDFFVSGPVNFSSQRGIQHPSTTPAPSGGWKETAQGVAVFVALALLLGGCWKIMSSDGAMQSYCSNAATVTVDTFGGDRSDWRAVYNECSKDPSKPWERR
jgi:hypothetical protein